MQDEIAWRNDGESDRFKLRPRFNRAIFRRDESNIAISPGRFEQLVSIQFRDRFVSWRGRPIIFVLSRRAETFSPSLLSHYNRNYARRGSKYAPVRIFNRTHFECNPFQIREKDMKFIIRDKPNQSVFVVQYWITCITVTFWNNSSVKNLLSLLSKKNADTCTSHRQIASK